MRAVEYWVFNETQLDEALRQWCSDSRHTDTSDEAVKARFETVSGFLYSDIADTKGLYIGAKKQAAFRDAEEASDDQ
ncbi:MAG: hypothetical protein ABW152_17900 [Candidatus Thiodiazotropha endolucinida]